MLPLWLTAELLLAAVSGRQYGQYFLPSLLVLSALLGITLDQAARWSEAIPLPTTGRRILQSGIVIGIVGMPLFGMLQALEPIARKGDWMNEPVKVAEHFVERHEAENEPIFVWGNVPGIYFEVDEPLPVKYGLILPLLSPYYATSGIVDELIKEFEQVRPSYILDMSGFEDIPTILDFDPGYRNGPYRLSEDMRRFFVYVAQHYERAAFQEDERLIVLRRRD